jgi:hypothetical protein
MNPRPKYTPGDFHLNGDVGASHTFQPSRLGSFSTSFFLGLIIVIKNLQRRKSLL